VLRRIFGLKEDEVIRVWRKLHNEGFHNVYSSPSITRMMMSKRVSSAGHLKCIREKRNTYRFLVGKP
jgi:hypothetical protein